MCTYRVLLTHRVEEGGGNLAIKRTILIDRYTQVARGRGSVGYNIHERLRGQYLLIDKHDIRGCGRE